MQRILIYIITIVCAVNPVLSQQQRTAVSERIDALEKELTENKYDKDKLKRVSELLINVGDYPKTIHYALILDSVAQKTKDQTSQLYAYIYLGQATMMIGDELISKQYMDKSLDLAIQLGDSTALASVYNGLGLYSSNIERDYYRAINYFLKGLEAAKQSSHERLYSILLANISIVYFLKEDTAGLKYALECYEHGHKKRDPYIIYCGALSSAHIYYLLKDYDKALQYSKEAEFLTERNDFKDKANLYNLYARILLDLGDDNGAEKMLYKALDDRGESQITSVVRAYIGLSMININRQNYGESIRLLKQALEFTKKNRNNIYTLELYKRLSELYELSADLSTALEYYKSYHDLYEVAFNADKERTVNELMIKYDTEKNENIIKQNKLELQQKESKIRLMLYVIILVVLISGGTYLLYIKKNKLYLQIVKQHQKSIKRETSLESQIEELKKQAESVAPDERYSTSSISEDKAVELYENLLSLLHNKKTYKQKNLTTDKLAQLLETNRTYLSQVINKQSGMSFNHFINSYRIEDAIRALSDLNNDIPLKALSSDLGFSSPTTFYNAFQTTVGMTPAIYREKVHLLKKQESKHLSSVQN